MSDANPHIDIGAAREKQLGDGLVANHARIHQRRIAQLKGPEGVKEKHPPEQKLRIETNTPNTTLPSCS